MRFRSGCPPRRHALVYMCHMDPAPGDLFACQITQHKPWSMTAAHSPDEAAARGDGGPGLRSDNRRTLSRDSVVIGENSNFHSSLQPAIAGLWPAASRGFFELAVMADQRIRRTVVSEFGLCFAVELGDDV